jgi:type II restriction/modification system DNA methylase subunit YeeA
MNLNAFKNFAPAVRRQLIEAVGRKLDFVLTGDTPDLREKAKQRMSIKGKAEKDRLGLVERVAYTWFNRLAALRFLDARGWHPFLCRVITPANEEETQPEILKLTRNGALPAELGPFTDPVRINDLLDGRIPSADPQGEVYRHLVLAACRYYHNLMPFLFEALDDETELLLPDDLLTQHSVAQGFRSAINDDDCAEVEIIGWLYQFYIAEKKDQVMARKSAVPTEDIPAVTQLFTPHWIVRYLVENSLGRLWLLNRPGSRLRKHMPYYIEGEPETGFLKITKPEEIRLLDPATGSGHMLTYSFDLLYLIYEEEGHAPSEIPGLILRHNLFGLEICPRATQLAQFALVCKAREKSRLAFSNPIQPQVMCLEDVIFDKDEMTAYLRLPGLCELFTEKVMQQIHQFHNTATFGSLLQLMLIAAEITALQARLSSRHVDNDLLLQQTHSKVLFALDQALMLSQRYHVVVANPPYMGGKQMNAEVKEFAQDKFPNSKSDVFAMFIERGFTLSLPSGFNAMITMQSWMFLSSFEKLRSSMIGSKSLVTMAHLGARSFDFISGAVVQTTAFVAHNQANLNYRGVFLRLIEGRNEDEKSAQLRRAIANPNCGWFFRASADDFKKIPGRPIAYWLNKKIIEKFAIGKLLGGLLPVRGGMTTADNDHFVRLWHEISCCKFAFPNSGLRCRWFPYNKGGEYRKWFGNRLWIVDWGNDGQAIKLTGRASVRSEELYLTEMVGWTDVTGFSQLGVRYYGNGFLFDASGPAVFPNKELSYPLVLSFLGSKIASIILQALNPTLHVQAGNISDLPWLDLGMQDQKIMRENALSVVNTTRVDWDSYETSWDFTSLPLLRGEKEDILSKPLSSVYAKLRASWKEMTLEMQRHEEENNRIFIEAYGLQEELTTDVPLNEITLTCNPHYRYSDKKSEEELGSLLLADTMKELISYAVGCMMGRYSLDAPGLILANAGDTLENYLRQVSKRRRTLDLRTALAEPLSVALREDASPKCFCCGKINSVSDAWFILADIYDRAEGQVCGRPMVYCKDCLKEKEERISLSRRLCDFSLAEAIDKKWAEQDTLSMFLELADCFEQRIPARPDGLAFVPDDDGILPVLDGEWFEDDIVARTRDFLRTTFGEATLEENLRFIEESLGKDLRKYFLTDFYKDHLQTYKKRPIYWLFQSPKKGFSALIYLHRYTRDTVNVLLNSYLRDYLHKIRSRIEHLEHVQGTSENAREKTAAGKESDALKKALHECEEYEREIILPLAQQRIELDLDDGVKVNYLKFGKALATIPGLAAKEEDG